MNLRFDDPVVGYLDELKGLLDPGSLKSWYFGHFHCDGDVSGARTGNSYHAVFNRLATIPEQD
jgi:hypothetical protein